jgi:hypothetical protein
LRSHDAPDAHPSKWKRDGDNRRRVHLHSAVHDLAQNRRYAIIDTPPFSDYFAFDGVYGQFYAGRFDCKIDGWKRRIDLTFDQSSNLHFNSVHVTYTAASQKLTLYREGGSPSRPRTPATSRVHLRPQQNFYVRVSDFSNCP